MRKEFGQHLRMLRQHSGTTARSFARALGMDPSNYAKVERGEFPPPTTEVLKRMSFILGIDPAYDERWYKFHYLADVSRGRIPADLMRRDDIVALLPALFDHLRSTEVTDYARLFPVMRALQRGEAVETNRAMLSKPTSSDEGSRPRQRTTRRKT